jgi:signal transduction histidine kinase
VFNRILAKLSVTAVKFTEAGSVQIIAEKRDGRRDTTGHSSGPAVSVGVVDSGIGIKQEDLQSLFRPFRQIETGLAREYEGTGH